MIAASLPSAALRHPLGAKFADPVFFRDAASIVPEVVILHIPQTIQILGVRQFATFQSQ